MPQMVKKAKFLCRDGCLLWYEYKGKEYCVNTDLWTSTAQQHRNNQLCIDAELEREKIAAEKDAAREHRYEDTAEYGLELFFKSVE